VLQAVKLYVGSHYGSFLSDLAVKCLEHLCQAGFIGPRTPQTLSDHLLCCCRWSNARTDILAGYTKFVRGMKANLSMELAVMFGVAQSHIVSVTWSIIALEDWKLVWIQIFHSQGYRRRQTKVASVPNLDR
jgi:hypothetical protein